MRITTWGEYALICSVHLAHRYGSGPVNGRELAQSERLPSDYVEQILLRLRRAGIVTSMRGSHGGYELARPPEVVSVREVLSAAEHATFDLHCVSHPVDAGRCADTGNCSIRPVWLLLQSKIDETLESVKLADLMPVEREVRERVGLPVLYA